LFLNRCPRRVTAGDQIIAQALRKSGKPVILAANQMRRPGRAAG